MTGFKTAALWTAAAVGIGAVALLGLPQLRMMIGGDGVSSFTKSAYDAQGNPLTGPVSVGQIIQYVLRYSPPVSGSSGPVTIVDTLSPNQSYVAGSIVAPGWTLSTPEYNLNTETYSSPGFGPDTGFTLDIPAISGSAGIQGGIGDGYEPVPVVTSVGTKVFGINHHEAINGKIMCWLGATLANCTSAYPLRVSTSPEQLTTPDFPHAAVYDKKIYFPAGRYDEVSRTTLEFGLGCWDAETDTACAFVGLPGQPNLNMGGTAAPYVGVNLDFYVAGVRADPQNPSHLLMFAQDKVHCVDIALPGAPACAGWTPPTIPPHTTGARSRDMVVEENGTRLFVSETLPPRVYCLNLSDGSFCAGWPAGGVNGGATSGTHLGPGIDSSGIMNAICLVQTFGASNFRCFSTVNGSNVTAWPVALSSSPIFAAYHIPGTTRVLYPPYTGAMTPKCHDFATNAACAPFTPYWKSSGSWVDGGGTTRGSVGDYGYASDPSAPQSCIYGLGHGGLLVRFGLDGTASASACTPQDYHATFNLDDLFCFHKPENATWTKIEILNRPAELAGGTITLTDSSGTVLQTISVTAADTYTVNLSATGTSSTVTLDFTPAYTGATLPATDYQIRLNYTADEQSQICYRTTVDGCGEVSNAATLTDEFSTLDANIDLGMAVGGECGPITGPDCLELVPSLAANPDGTGTLTLSGGSPPGFSSTLVTVRSTAGGVTVISPSQTFGGGSIQGNWNLTGLVPGMTVSFMVDAVETGGGSKPGTDLCCSGVVEVTVAEDGTEPEEEPEIIDLTIEKTAEAGTEEQQGAGPPTIVNFIDFTLRVTNTGAPFTGQNAIVVTDIVPPGMTFTNASGTDWDCGPVGQFPIPAGGTLSCVYLGTAQIATGAQLPPITIRGNVSKNSTSRVYENCAAVGLTPESGRVDGNNANNQGCATTEVDAPTVTLPPPPKPDPECDPRSTRLKGGQCQCRYEGMTRKTATVCACPSGSSLVAGEGCVKSLTCDKYSAVLRGGECSCRYPTMSKVSPTACSCPAGEFLVTDVGCVQPVDRSEPDEPDVPETPHASCTDGQVMEPGIGCVPLCTAPMTLNGERTACECPKGTREENGSCVKKSNFLDNLNIGIGIGNSNRSRSGGGAPQIDLAP